MRTLDYFVVALYFVAVLAVGIVSRGRKRNINEYFNAHGTFKGPLGTVIIGLSIAASFFSGVTFIVMSSFAYSTGLQIVFGLISIPIAWVMLRFWFLERYLAAHNSGPYDIVEKRFGYPMRACLSIMFICLRMAWMGVIVYSPTLIIMGALNLDQSWFWPIVLMVGGTCTVVAVIGGLRAVIIIDAVQFLIITVGLVLIIVSVLSRMHWATGAIWADLKLTDHLHLCDFSLSLTRPWTVWAIVIGSTVSNVSNYMADQMALQRYLASESRSAVFRSFFINMVGATTVCLLLVVVGLLLSVWYLHHPDPDLPHNPDLVLPFFAARQLAAGMSGLLIAAIIAATMNTLTSGINSLAGAITHDFLTRLGRARSPVALFRTARVISAVLGLVATLSAGFASRLGSVLNSSNIMQGAFQGAMFACMVWTISRARVRASAVLCGMVLGGVTGWIVALTPVSSFWVGPAAFGVAMVVPWIDAVFGGRSAAAGQLPAQVS